MTHLEKQFIAEYSKVQFPISYLDFLNIKLETAQEKKQYARATEIRGIIADEINADNEYYEYSQQD